MRDMFYSPRLTLARAQHHIREFSAVVDVFVNSKPWANIIDKASNPGKDTHKIQITSDLPDVLPCILFDATNNLRAVLDQAGYASAVAARSPSLKAIKFPFAPTETEWRRHMTGACKDLPPEILTVFEKTKGYKEGNNILWALYEIANAKKHFALKPLIVTSPSAFYTAEIVGDGGREEIVSPGGFGMGWDAVRREVTLAVTSAGAKVNMTADLAFSIVIEGVEVLGNQQAVHFLNAAYGEVMRILVTTEAECRRVGYQK